MNFYSYPKIVSFCDDDDDDDDYNYWVGEWWPNGIVGSNRTRVTTMIPHTTPVLVGSRKWTLE